MGEALQIITYDEIIREDFKKLDQAKEKADKWVLLVQSGKAIMKSSERHQIALAELALKSCLIYWGGHPKAGEFETSHSKLTLKRFANSIKIDYKRLQEYVAIKRRIWDHLTVTEKHELKIRYARAAAWELNKTFRYGLKEPTKAEALEVYKKHNGTTKVRKFLNTRYKSDSVGFLYKAVNLLCKKKMYFEITEEKRLEADKLILELNKIQAEYRRIKKIGEKMGGVSVQEGEVPAEARWVNKPKTILRKN